MGVITAVDPAPVVRAPATRRPDGPWIAATFLLSRLLLVGYVALVTLALGLDPTGRRVDPVAWALDRFVWWDSFHFLRIARQGYVKACCDQAFFPGYPLSTAAVGRLTGDLALAGLLVSLVAGVVAAVLLHRLGVLTSGDRRVGLRAAGYLTVAPTGIFLTMVYSEALFLALALGAWLCGLRRRWWWAGLLAAGATGVRISGLFLVAGLAVMYLQQLPPGGILRRPRPDVLALLLPAGSVAGFVVALHSATGSWNAWREAEETGWDRQSAWPWQGLLHGWNQIWHMHSTPMRISRAADLVVVLGGLLLLAVVVRLRQWPEAVYLALSLAVLVCSTTLVSAPRYALAWFPGYLLVARYGLRPGRRWLHPTVLAGCLALLAVVGWAVTSRHWVA